MDLNHLLASFASAFQQQHRQLTLQLGEQDNNQLLPQTLDGEEGVSQSYCYRVGCLSPLDHIKLKTLLGLPACIAIRAADGGEDHRCGVVSEVRQLGADGGFAHYQLTIEAPFSLLRHRRCSRVFQSLSVPDIIKQIMAEHQAANPQFARTQTLDINVRPAPVRSYCLQYRESDYDFIVRLLHEEGYAWCFGHRGGEVPQVQLQIFDDAHGLPAARIDRVRFHRSDASEQEDGLGSWQSQRRIVPGNVVLASFDYQRVSTGSAEDDSAVDQGHGGQALQRSLQDYDPQSLYYASDDEQLSHYARLRQQAHDQDAKQFEGSGSVRGLGAGQWFRLDDHPTLDGESAARREFVVTAQQLSIRNNLPQSLESLLPAALRPTLAADTPPYQTRFRAQRRGLPLTPPYRDTALARPRAPGVQTATVVGPPGEEVHTDAHGRIKVQFHWQRPAEHPHGGAAFDDGSSCWLRVAMPSAGSSWGHQFIPRIGQEVLVDFIEGDIDRPVVTGVLYNGNHAPPDFSDSGSLPANKALSGIKSREHHGRQYNELLFDDTAGEVRAKLSSEHGKSQLNLGYLTHPRRDGKANPRGEGAELRSDASIAIRAGAGLLLSTYEQLQAGGSQLARNETLALLEQCADLARACGEYAAGHQARAPDMSVQDSQIERLKQWENGSNTAPEQQGGGQPVINLSARGGLSYSTPQGVLGYAGLNYDLTAKKHLQFTAGEHFSLCTGQGISQFAQSGDVRLIAHQGQLLLQAQANDIMAQADKNISIMAVNGEIVLTAPRLRLVSQDGSFIRIDNNITLGTQGVVNVHASSKRITGPASDSVPMPAFQSGPVDQQFLLNYPHRDGRPGDIAANRDYQVTLQDGRILSGTADENGHSQQLSDVAMQIARVRILPQKD